jgi:bifunctional DNA-binding transcriptional regulator/antitoxin component of YhaV-PrlF toxin-antitoxin module
MYIKCGVDNLGRVTLPIQYRRALNIDVKDEVNVVFRDNGLFIYKEDAKDILKRKINEIIDVANDCVVLNGRERESLNKILSKLV